MQGPPHENSLFVQVGASTIGSRRSGSEYDKAGHTYSVNIIRDLSLEIFRIHKSPGWKMSHLFAEDESLG